MLYSHLKLAAHLKSSVPELAFLFFSELPSTNAYLMAYARTTSEQAFCITSNQTAGYGQRSRQWLNASESLTFSIRLTFPAACAQLDGLTPLIGLQLVDSLREFTEGDYALKWPNDVYLHGRKVAGILVESIPNSEGQADLVIGMGINVNPGHAAFDDELKQLRDEVNAGFVNFNSDCDEVVERFLSHITRKLYLLSRTFAPGLFKTYAENYRLIDYFEEDEPVIVYHNGHCHTGLYKGLNQEGALQLLIENDLQTFCSGAVSIRKFNE